MIIIPIKEKTRKVQPICRVCPAVVARHPEIMDLAKPRGVAEYPRIDFEKRKRQISAIVQEKLFSI